jgi:hypothetical protein
MARKQSKAVRKIEKAVRKAVKKGVNKGAVEKAVSQGIAKGTKKKPAASVKADLRAGKTAWSSLGNLIPNWRIRAAAVRDRSRILGLRWMIGLMQDKIDHADDSGRGICCPPGAEDWSKD